MPRTLVCSALFIALCFSAFGEEEKNQPKGLDESQINLLKQAIEHYRSAGEALKSGNIDLAVSEYRTALEEDPDEPYWHLALAMALKKEGDRQGILEDYEVARKLAPDDEALWRSYASLLLGPAPLEGTQAAEVKGKTPPHPAYSPDPPYSEKARAAKYSPVTCVVQLVVSPQGNVENVQVVKPVGLGLDENAVNTVRTWKFRPATPEGVLVRQRMLVEISFRLFLNESPGAPHR